MAQLLCSFDANPCRTQIVSVPIDVASMQRLGARGSVYRTVPQNVGQRSAVCRRSRTALCSARSSTSQQQSTRAAADAPSSIQRHVARPTTMGAALTGFSLIAAGVFLPANNQPSYLAESAVRLVSSNDLGAAQAATSQAAASASDPTSPVVTAAADPAVSVMSSPLLDLDQAVHSFVTTHIGAQFRSVAADIYISDVFITAGICGWLICSAICVQAAPKKAVGPLSLAWAFYFITCGAYSANDPLLVNFLKHVFARIRPSPMHHTFSFPSGHTSTAVFIVGALVTVLLPLTVQLWTEKGHTITATVDSAEVDSSSDTGLTEAVPESDGSSIDISYGSVSSSEVFWQRYDVAALGIWAAAWVTTATGRVLADAHWVSDTLAGGCLAVASVSGLAWCCRFLHQETNISGVRKNSTAVRK